MREKEKEKIVEQRVCVRVRWCVCMREHPAPPFFNCATWWRCCSLHNAQILHLASIIIIVIIIEIIYNGDLVFLEKVPFPFYLPAVSYGPIDSNKSYNNDHDIININNIINNNINNIIDNVVIRTKYKTYAFFLPQSPAIKLLPLLNEVPKHLKNLFLPGTHFIDLGGECQISIHILP